MNKTSDFGSLYHSETTTCHKCGQLIRWASYRLEETEDDKFRNVMEKLQHHYLNDKSCIREQKLKVLLSNE